MIETALYRLRVLAPRVVICTALSMGALLDPTLRPHAGLLLVLALALQTTQAVATPRGHGDALVSALWLALMAPAAVWTWRGCAAALAAKGDPAVMLIAVVGLFGPFAAILLLVGLAGVWNGLATRVARRDGIVAFAVVLPVPLDVARAALFTRSPERGDTVVRETVRFRDIDAATWTETDATHEAAHLVLEDDATAQTVVTTIHPSDDAPGVTVTGRLRLTPVDGGTLYEEQAVLSVVTWGNRLVGLFGNLHGDHARHKVARHVGGVDPTVAGATPHTALTLLARTIDGFGLKAPPLE